MPAVATASALALRTAGTVRVPAISAGWTPAATAERITATIPLPTAACRDENAIAQARASCANVGCTTAAEAAAAGSGIAAAVEAATCARPFSADKYKQRFARLNRNDRVDAPASPKLFTASSRSARDDVNRCDAVRYLKRLLAGGVAKSLVMLSRRHEIVPRGH